MSTIFDSSSGNLSTSGSTQRQVAGGGLPAKSINRYLNPYQKEVLNDTLSRMQDQFGVRLASIGDQAVASRAFGSGRHGIVEGMAFDDYMRNVGETSNQINQQGFNTALNASFQDVGQRQRAADSLASLGINQYNLGRDMMNTQATQGAQERQIAQQLMDLTGQDLSGYISSPANSTAQTAGIVSGSPLVGNITQTTKPGIFDYLGLGLQTIGGMKTIGGGK